MGYADRHATQSIQYKLAAYVEQLAADYGWDVDELLQSTFATSSPPRCGCEEVGSPVAGAIWLPGTGEIQRCDTHQPIPLFETDREAADAMALAGFTVEIIDGAFIGRQEAS